MSSSNGSGPGFGVHADHQVHPHDHRVHVVTGRIPFCPGKWFCLTCRGVDGKLPGTWFSGPECPRPAVVKDGAR